MVCGQLLDKRSVTVSMSCRSAILKYRSTLVHTLTTLALAPLYVFDYIEEKQTIEVELYANFQDDQVISHVIYYYDAYNLLLNDQLRLFYRCNDRITLWLM